MSLTPSLKLLTTSWLANCSASSDVRIARGYLIQVFQRKLPNLISSATIRPHNYSAFSYLSQWLFSAAAWSHLQCFSPPRMGGSWFINQRYLIYLGRDGCRLALELVWSAFCRYINVFLKLPRLSSPFCWCYPTSCW